MEFRAYLNVLRRNLLLIGACTAVVMGLVAFASYRTTPLYESTARVFVSASQPGAAEAYAGGLLSEQRATAYVALVDSRVLAEQVKEELGLGVSVPDLTDQVGAIVVKDTGVLQLTVTDPDPHHAQLLAETYAEELIKLARDLDTPERSSTSPVKISVIDPASYSATPVSPQPVRNLVLALLFGLVLGVAVALLRELLDTTVKNPDDLASATDAALMGSIVQESAGNRGRLVTELDVNAPRVEAFRVLRTNIQFVEVDQSNKVFVVSSAVQEEGKTSTAVNLALSLAQVGIRVLLVDGDLRRPAIAGMLGLDESAGVTTVLLGKISLREAVQRHAITDLDVLTSGMIPPNASELLQSKAMAALMTQMRAAYDVVIIDSPPLLPVTDAALLASQADGALLVVRHGRTTRDQLATAVDRLEQVDAALVGVVMNMVPLSKSVLGYSYRSYGHRPPTFRGGAGRTRRTRRS